MILAIISAVACLAVTTLMYSPKFRGFAYYRPFALFFLLEGIWILADYAFAQIMPGNVFMDIIHYCVIVAMVIYFILSILLRSDKKKSRREK